MPHYCTHGRAFLFDLAYRLDTLGQQDAMRILVDLFTASLRDGSGQFDSPKEAEEAVAMLESRAWADVQIGFTGKSASWIHGYILTFWANIPVEAWPEVGDMLVEVFSATDAQLDAEGAFQWYSDAARAEVWTPLDPAEMAYDAGVPRRLPFDTKTTAPARAAAPSVPRNEQPVRRVLTFTPRPRSL